ncbi:unnamed protein product [Soboliphyme baturini]|uniref:adenylate cyclase n=1 Tax=Soboliphyme baturini TaxID=241478 RepID=A0A183IPG8_9BILA|nr:unnamed protein product [Soboliphyme baturini]
MRNEDVSLKHRDPLVFFERSSYWRWNPEFTSPLLEGQYWQCAFPQLRLRFRSGVAYSITFATIWLLYFISLYPLADISYYVLCIVLVISLLAAIFALTLCDKIYMRFYGSISVLCLLLICFVSCALFLLPSPLITAFGLFALSIEVVLFVYTVVPLPLYLCMLFAMVFSVTYECSGMYVASVPYFPGIRLGAHLMAHILGVHIFILSEVRSRKTFLKSGQSLLVRHDLEIEKQFKDRMIQSVMPRLMAEELMKESNELKQRPSSDSSRTTRASLFRPFNMNRMSDVSILFADIAGFTKMSTNKSAEQLVDLLSDLFGRFDALCGASGCEKISTLGDCYYCVSGCPEPRSDHAKCCVKMGLDMITAIKQFDKDRGEDVNMRVGIHTGTVLCGIVGTKRFKFDVFSNDVTLANRMESTGMPGKVHISEVTAKYLNDQYLLEEAKPCESTFTSGDDVLESLHSHGSVQASCLTPPLGAPG